jgi:hypothetical protein
LPTKRAKSSSATATAISNPSTVNKSSSLIDIGSIVVKADGGLRVDDCFNIQTRINPDKGGYCFLAESCPEFVKQPMNIFYGRVVKRQIEVVHRTTSENPPMTCVVTVVR